MKPHSNRKASENKSMFCREGRIAVIIIVVAWLLQWFSPKSLSSDSAFYLEPAVSGENLIHPHHLFYTLILRGFYKIGQYIGLGSMPYYPMRAGMIILAGVGLTAIYGFLRLLSVRPVFCALVGLFVSVSGLFWQFSTQMEAYIPTMTVIALSCYVALAGCIMPWDRRQYGVFALTGTLLAIATTLHQAAALTAPAIGLMIFLNLRGYGKGKKQAITAAVLTVIFSGCLSISMYILGWYLSNPNVSFLHWMTKYAHYEGMPWGVPENLTLTGLISLIRSWGSSWFNFTPEAFYDGVPKSYIFPVLALISFFALLTFYLLVQTMRRKIQIPHVIWILAWLLPVEIFIWWWTPFLKNFQAIVILPQAAILGLAIENLAGDNKTNRFSFREGVAIFLLLLCVGSTFFVNFKYMILPGLKDRLAPEGDLLLVRPLLDEGDVFVAEFPASLNMKALLDFNNNYSLVQPALLQNIPDWAADPSAKIRELIVYKTTIGFSRIALDRSRKTFEERWDPVMDKIIASAGGLDKLRAQVLTDSQGLVAVTFGVSPDLPVTGAEALRRMSLLAGRVPDASRDASTYFMKRLPVSLRNPEVAQKRNAALSKGKQESEWIMPFIDKGKPVWSPGFDTESIEVTSTSIVGKVGTGRDPIIWTNLPRPIDFSIYTHIEIEGSILPNGNAVDSSFQFFFPVEDKSNVENSSILIPWKADGQVHQTTIDLSEYAFMAYADKVHSLRLDTGDIPNSTFTINRIKFYIKPD